MKPALCVRAGGPGMASAPCTAAAHKGEAPLVRLYETWKVPIIWSASSLASFSRKRTPALRSSFLFKNA